MTLFHSGLYEVTIPEFVWRLRKIMKTSDRLIRLRFEPGGSQIQVHGVTSTDTI
jgi:hypothetical protein